MSKAKKIQSSTQRFTEIKDIIEDIVLFTNGHACLIIEVRATNFALMSEQEQNAKIYAYASFLNSLSFPVQIFIQSQKIDISAYIKLIEAEIQKTKNEMLATSIVLYRDFVEELVKVNAVLDKRFFIVIPYNPLEKGATATVVKKQGQNEADGAKTTLRSKGNSVLTQLASLNLPAKTLQKEDLIKLFYGIYNEGLSDQAVADVQDNAPIISGGLKQ